ncbi:MAG: hypothetical protein HOK98_15705 [Rhodospirillaceae bacterium]|jgi:hypothetical protein|nr:hypothetical protein [Rhodospirillaceae bacterium]MBT6404127.1 hypothetical protein [Rhodospirillaceae bacterium]MBT6537619.1 hypothetical protein [Rhodospirillaceae bacterium]MBT7361707.1 hypothetical protein [Rhodospirillaceae bacterium]
MSEIHNIQRLRDGSIDIAHYARKGRALHGAAVCQTGRSFTRIVAKVFMAPSTLFGGWRRSGRAPVAVAAE